MRASALTTTGPVGRPSGMRTDAVLRSLAPVLDRAFGLEDASAFPDEIAALLARLEAEPPPEAEARPVLEAA